MQAPGPKKPRRWDLQDARKTGLRGSRPLAMAAAAEIAGGDEESLRELDGGKLAPSSRKPKEARRAFVEDLTVLATGSLDPLTPYRLLAKLKVPGVVLTSLWALFFSAHAKLRVKLNLGVSNMWAEKKVPRI